jgi:hypothetical protein
VTREIFEQQYKRAAAEGALVELRLRLLADKVPELQSIAHDEKLWKVENLIAQHFANALTDEEKEALGLCREFATKSFIAIFVPHERNLSSLGPTPSGVTPSESPFMGFLELKWLRRLPASKRETPRHLNMSPTRKDQVLYLPG